MGHRTIDMLLVKHRLISNLSSIALLFIFVAILILATSGFGNPERFLDQVEGAMGLALGAALVFSFLSMIGSTFYAILHRASLSDWKIFLMVTWLIPYLGVSLYVGGANLLAFRGRVRKGRF